MHYFLAIFLLPPSPSLFLLRTIVSPVPLDLGEELFLHLAWGSTELLHNQINIAMIHPLATTASSKFCWRCLAAYEIKKTEREWEEEKKKPLVKNLSAIDFLPCWSSTYHPTFSLPCFFFFLPFVEPSAFQVQFFSQVNKEVVWQWGGAPGRGGARGVARFLSEEARQPAVWSVLIRWRVMDRSSTPNKIFHKSRNDSQTSKRNKKKESHPPISETQSPWKYNSGEKISPTELCSWIIARLKRKETRCAAKCVKPTVSKVRAEGHLWPSERFWAAFDLNSRIP